MTDMTNIFVVDTLARQAGQMHTRVNPCRQQRIPQTGIAKTDLVSGCAIQLLTNTVSRCSLNLTANQNRRNGTALQCRKNAGQ